MTRTQFWIAGAVVSLAVVFVGWKSSRPPQLETVKVRFEDVTSTLAVSGVIEATNKSTVSSQLPSALVKRVVADIGKQVKAGEVLVVLDDAEYRAQMQAANAQVQQSDSQSHLYDVTASTAAKNLKLAETGLTSVNDLKAVLATAQTNRDLAQARLLEAMLNLDKVRENSRIEQVRIAKAQLDKVEATRIQKEVERVRSRYLFQEGAISGAADLVAQTALATAVEDVNVARQNLILTALPRSVDVKVAEAQVSEARASLDGTTQSLALAQQSFSQRIVHQQEVVMANGQLETARADRGVSEAARLSGMAQRQTASTFLSKTIIRAPFKGRVSQRLVEPGQTVTAGSPLMILAGTSHLRITLNVEESSIGLIKVGAKAIVTFDAYPELMLPAVVSEISSAANFQLGTVEVRLELVAHDPRIKPEMTADANIVTSKWSQVLVVPRSALMNGDESPSLYVVEGGFVNVRPVKWLKGNADTIIIRSGIAAGDQVITAPRTTKPGARVDIRSSQAIGGA